MCQQEEKESPEAIEAKQYLKRTAGCCLGLISIPVLLFIAFVIWAYAPPIGHHIKTEYGDHFIAYDVCTLFVDDSFYIKDDNSDFRCVFLNPVRKKDVQAVCDTPYFRCYHIEENLSNPSRADDVYIFKLKDTDSFYYISYDEPSQEYTRHILQDSFGELVKSHLLCDEHIIEVAGPALTDVFPLEMENIARNLNNENYDALKKYGLTDEMVKDTDSLMKKKNALNWLLS